MRGLLQVGRGASFSACRVLYKGEGGRRGSIAKEGSGTSLAHIVAVWRISMAREGRKRVSKLFASL